VGSEELQKILKDGCREIGVPCIPALRRIIREISSYWGVEAKSSVPGSQHELDDDYFARIEALNFALAHDDGQQTDELEEADVVLVGPSRTSKTPTCVYLSYRGVCAANVPFVKGCPLPENLFGLKVPLVVGLILSPERLVQIRRSRLQSLSEERITDYTEIDKVKSEVVEAKKLFAQQKWPVLDVTRSSIEETVAKIINLYKEHQKAKEMK
jgi:regulator of PEP synthase PpsR (kinase-PPPase family)